MKYAYKFRIYPNRQERAKLELALEVCRHLWNDALADRKNTWDLGGVSRNYYQQAELLRIEKENGRYSGVYSQVLQDVLRRLKKGFDNFFRRVQEGAKEKGYPRFKSQYKSITYPQSGFKLEGSRLTLSKIGAIRVFKHREIEGKIKTCTIKKDGTGAWYAIFVTEQDSPVKIEPRNAIGIDLGITHAVATSDGKYFEYPRYYVKGQKKIRSADKSLHRKVLGSQNREKARVKLSRVSKRVTNLRNEFHHQVTRKLVDSADLIAFEKLNIQGMLQNHNLAKHIHDVSWGKLIRLTHSKAERAGKSVVLVDPRNTSQRCSACGETVSKDLRDRVHACPHCGLLTCRDHNAALNILTLGLRGIAYGDLTSGLRKRSSKRRIVEAGSPGL